MLRKFATVLFLVSAVANSTELPEPKNKIAFDNFKKSVADFLIKEEIESINNGKESLVLESVNGPYSTEKMYHDYKQNELVANKKYKGKRNRVTGVVDSVTEDFMGNAVVKTTSQNYFLGGAMLNVDRDDPYILKLVPGSPVDMVCIGGGFIMDSPVLNKCISSKDYIISQFKTNSKLPLLMNGMAYVFYIPNEDILSSACQTRKACMKLIAAVADDDETLAKDIAEKERIDKGLTEENIKERLINIISFIKENEQAIKEKYGDIFPKKNDFSYKIAP